jgi:hypothetical protein
MFFREAGLWQGTEMEHKEMRDHWKAEHDPTLKGPYRLKTWQNIAVTFFHYLQESGYPGGMLCDEMRIGKVLPNWLTHGANFYRQFNRFRSSKQTTKCLKVRVWRPPNVWQTWSYGITPLIIPSGLETLETLGSIWKRWLICSPKHLESIWVRVCAQFFEPAVLQAKP